MEVRFLCMYCYKKFYFVLICLKTKLKKRKKNPEVENMKLKCKSSWLVELYREENYIKWLQNTEFLLYMPTEIQSKNRKNKEITALSSHTVRIYLLILLFWNYCSYVTGQRKQGIMLILLRTKCKGKKTQ